MKKLSVLILFLTLVSCASKPPPETGKVLSKRYEPAHWVGGYEDTGEEDCSLEYDYFEDEWNWECEDVQEWNPHHRWVNDTWALQLKNCQAQAKDPEADCDTGWRTVNGYDYERHKLGDYFPKVDEHG